MEKQTSQEVLLPAKQEQKQPTQEKQLINKSLNIDTDLPQVVPNVPPPPRGNINKNDFFSENEEYEYQNPTEEQLEKKYDETEE